MRVLIIANSPATASAYAHDHQLSEWKWVWELEDLEDERQVFILFARDHTDIPIEQWFALRKQVEVMVINGDAKWFVV